MPFLVTSYAPQIGGQDNTAAVGSDLLGASWTLDASSPTLLSLCNLPGVNSSPERWLLPPRFPACLPWLHSAKYPPGPLCHSFEVAGTSGKKPNPATDFILGSTPNRSGSRKQKQVAGVASAGAGNLRAAGLKEPSRPLTSGVSPHPFPLLPTGLER